MVTFGSCKARQPHIAALPDARNRCTDQMCGPYVRTHCAHLLYTLSVHFSANALLQIESHCLTKFGNFWGGAHKGRFLIDQKYAGGRCCYFLIWRRYLSDAPAARGFFDIPPKSKRQACTTNFCKSCCKVPIQARRACSRTARTSPWLAILRS